MLAEHSSLWQLSALPGLDLKLSSVVDFFLLSWPYLLPPIVVFALEGPLSLRTWLAIQRIPLSPKGSTSTTQERALSAEHVQRRVVTYVAPVYLLAITLFGAFLQCGIHASTRTMRAFDSITLAPLFIYSTSQLFALCSGMYTLRAFRDAEGDPYICRTLRLCVPKFLSAIPFLAGLGVSLHAIIARDAISQSIVHAALLHVVVMNDVVSTKSFRSMIYYACANVLTLFSIGFFFASHPASLRLMLRFGSEHPEAVDANHWPLFALAVLWNVFPVELVILCFRFDYTRARERAELAFAVLNSQSATTLRRASFDGEKRGQDAPLTHDMLLGGMIGEYNVKGAGPIFLASSDPDSLYSTKETFKDGGEEPAELELPIPISSPDTFPGTALPSSLRLPHPTHARAHAEFPHTTVAVLAFFYSSTTFLYLLSHVSALIRIPGLQHASLVWYGAPLLPLATFPLMIVAVFLVRRGDSGEVWRYKEVWGAEDGEITMEGKADV